MGPAGPCMKQENMQGRKKIERMGAKLFAKSHLDD
jgi:hypothetical protein